MNHIEDLLSEMRDLSYQQFQKVINKGLDDQGEFDKLRNEEKELNYEIKKLTEDFKKA